MTMVAWETLVLWRSLRTDARRYALRYSRSLVNALRYSRSLCLEVCLEVLKVSSYALRYSRSLVP